MDDAKRDAALRDAYGSRTPEQPEPPDIPVEALEALVRGEGTEADRLRTLNEVMKHRESRREFELLRATHQATASEATAPPGEVDRGWRNSGWLRVAAIVAVLVGGVSLWQTVEQGTTEPVLRSGASALQLVEPGAGARVDVPPTFVWRSHPGVRGYRLQVLTAAGTVLLDRTVSDTSHVSTDTDTWAPGEYVWWVTAQGSSGQELASGPRMFAVTR